MRHPGYPSYLDAGGRFAQDMALARKNVFPPEPPAPSAVDAKMSALLASIGYARRVVVQSAKELDELPRRSVILAGAPGAHYGNTPTPSKNYLPYWKLRDGWARGGTSLMYDSHEIPLPALVIYDGSGIEDLLHEE